MPRLALAIFAVWFLSLFGLRTLLHWRQTGSTGFRGFHGRPGSLPWLAGASVGLGIALALLAPVALLRGWPGSGLLISSGPVHALGAVLALVGTVGGLLAQHAMGSAWRIGVDEGEKTALVTEGLFARVRNPIFSFMLLSAAGFVLLVPNVPSLLACALTVFGIEAQVRFVEEPYLRRSHGSAYARYAQRVGRFLPGVGRLERG